MDKIFITDNELNFYAIYYQMKVLKINFCYKYKSYSKFKMIRATKCHAISVRL